MFGQPFYQTYPVNRSYDPHLHSYYQPQYPKQPYQNYYTSSMMEQAARERARAIAQQRARRAKYLPDEDENSDDEWAYNQLGPREQMYLDALRQRSISERRQQEQEQLARQRAAEDRRWQESLERREQEDQETRRHILQDMRRQQEIRHNQSRQDSLKEAKSEPDSIPINGRSSGNNKARSPSPQSTNIPLSSSPKSNRSIPIRRATPKPLPQYGEAHDRAALCIQKRYRIHRALRTIQDIEHQYSSAKDAFVFPATLDFQHPESEDGVLTLKAVQPGDTADDDMDTDMNAVDGKLVYNSANYALHMYMDVLGKLLVKLDEVESWGDKKVRERRREVVKKIEGEANCADRFWKGTWRLRNIV